MSIALYTVCKLFQPTGSHTNKIIPLITKDVKEVRGNEIEDHNLLTLTTAFSQRTDILSSTPLIPLGILRKSL